LWLTVEGDDTGGGGRWRFVDGADRMTLVEALPPTRIYCCWRGRPVVAAEGDGTVDGGR